MPIGGFEREVLRVVAANRNPDRSIAGGTVLHQAADSPRRSEDIDVFHDAPEALRVAHEIDVAALRKAGFAVEGVGRIHDDFRRARVSRDGRQTKLEWVVDAAFRFFPVEADPELGWRLNFWDGATNKVLALAGRQKLRDFLDCLHLHRRHLHLGALAWAAAGKDPGLTPEFILDWALRGHRFYPEDVADVRLEQPLDLVAAKQEWFEAVQAARQLVSRLPARDLGCLYLDASGRPVCPDPDAPGFDGLRRHHGILRGPLARMIE